MNIKLKKNRNSNLEFLRIIAMFFIVAHHWSVHGFGFNLPVSTNLVIVNFFALLGKIGVCIFILISSYFMINSNFTLRKFLNLEGEVYFYSIMFLIIFTLFITPVNNINTKIILKSLFPLGCNAYWFYTDYIILMIISPFLNKFIHSISTKDYLKLMIILIGIWSIYPTIFGKYFGFNDMIWFIVLYVLGGFIRLHISVNKINIWRLSYICILFLALMSILYISTNFIGILTQNKLIFDFSKNFIKSQNLFVLIISLLLFLIFLGRKEFNNKYINVIAGSSFGVYLIHDNIIVRSFLWEKILNNISFYYSHYLILFALFSIPLVYVICTVIDLIRRYSIEKLWFYILDKKLDKIEEWFNKTMSVLKLKFKFILINYFEIDLK